MRDSWRDAELALFAFLSSLVKVSFFGNARFLSLAKKRAATKSCRPPSMSILDEDYCHLDNLVGIWQPF
ncbi:MAG: hypothetical protein CSB23_01390 [Deltaproteobacteria bacterium]|nr:MAG: hypothetical protein CSB23_01390 [Deltaproteobacteria bacterium]